MKAISRAGSSVVLAALLLAAPAQAGQQPAAGRDSGTAAPDPRVIQVVDGNARETRDRLSRMLTQYPTTLAEVLRRDPTLLRNDAYLAPYPALAAFLGQHPEIAHNPAYFLGNPN